MGTTTAAESAGMDECASHSEQAEHVIAPADIVFVVDNSGSMQDEAQAVQDNLNTFSTQIIESGIDVRVTLISSYPGNGYGICVDPPLGVGGCPSTDSNPPLFNHLEQRVNSNDALHRVLEHQTAWGPTVRPDSSLHFVVVSDDESSLSALDFDAQIRALHPDHIDYKLHAIVSMQDCPEAARVGETYITLTQLTGGIASDLCLQDFQPVFDQLATEVIAGSQITCEWAIPQPEGNQTLNPNQVNVEFDDGEGEPEIIGRVESEADCATVADGWYYDDPDEPTTIIACEQTCARMQEAMEASISITLGCDTIPAG